MNDLISSLRSQPFNVEFDIKYDQEWTDEELLSHIIYLNCAHRQLTNLPDLPNCKVLHCSNNKLTDLPNLSNCKKLHCSYNRLINLPNLPNCKILDCQPGDILEYVSE